MAAARPDAAEMHQRLNAERARVRSAKAAHAATVAQQNELQAALRAALERVRTQRATAQAHLQPQPQQPARAGTEYDETMRSAGAAAHQPVSACTQPAGRALQRRRPVSALPERVAAHGATQAAGVQVQRPFSAVPAPACTAAAFAGKALRGAGTGKRPQSAALGSANAHSPQAALGQPAAARGHSGLSDRPWAARRGTSAKFTVAEPASIWQAQAGLTDSEVDSMLQARPLPVFMT